MVDRRVGVNQESWNYLLEACKRERARGFSPYLSSSEIPEIWLLGVIFGDLKKMLRNARKQVANQE